MIAQTLKPIPSPVRLRTAAPPLPHQPIQVLVIDDEEPLRRLLRTILQSAGYAVTTAGNAQEALQLFHNTPFDVVLVDVMMPDINGHALCKELRALGNTPIIMVSAMNRPQAVIDGFAAGADDYINKPFQMREIDLRIKALLRCIERCNQVHALQPG